VICHEFQQDGSRLPEGGAWIRPGVPALVLAPMEGVTDAPMREFMGRQGDFTHLVTEFFRISQDVPGIRTFQEHMPELRAGRDGRVTSGTAVTLQLLGGDAEKLALAAERAVRGGALGIDLNFGCPAPTVNRNDGGATLLKYPERIEGIVRAVRSAVPESVPVSAKLRLGFDRMDAIDENAERAVRGGAAWITIHGRTKVQGYQPPAYWDPIGRVRRALAGSGIPVVANGEIFTREDFLRCRDETGCEHYMIGRGALADPALPGIVARELGLMPQGSGGGDISLFRHGDLRAWHGVLSAFCDIGAPFVDRKFYLVQRVKQWLRYAWVRGNAPWFDTVKRFQTEGEILEWLELNATVYRRYSPSHRQDSP
jgi:tRNA-dihydrouridine synthase C